MLEKRSVVLVKDEVTYNTDSVPVAGTDAVLCESMSWAFSHARMHARKPVRPSMAPLQSIYAGTLINVSGKCEIKGSGTAGTAPEIAPILRACGFSETLVAVTSATYKPQSNQANHKSSTVYFYDDGLLLKLTGCRGKCSFDMQVGSIGMMSFDLTGHFVSLTDIALPTPTFRTNLPPALVNVPFLADAYAAVISKLSIDMGLEVSVPDSIAAADGFGQVQITGRHVTGSFDPQRVTKATYDFIAKWQGGNQVAIDTGVIGAVAGNKYEFSLPVCIHNSVGRGAKNNVGTYEMKFQADETAAGDDEVSLIFT